MKLKVQHILDATAVVATIIRENRAMPQNGKFRLSRLHTKLEPEAVTINKQYNEMVTAYDHRKMIPNPENNVSDEDRAAAIADGKGDTLPPKEIEVNAVPDEHMPEFSKKWAEFLAEEIEVDVEPVPLDQLCLPGDLTDGSIRANEFIVLGCLVRD